MAVKLHSREIKTFFGLAFLPVIARGRRASGLSLFNRLVLPGTLCERAVTFAKSVLALFGFPDLVFISVHENHYEAGGRISQ